MTNRLSFSVENAELVKSNPKSNFALVAFDFFASGENLHDMYVSEETLMRTAEGIKNCPIVWAYDEVLDDAETHNPNETPCGFVPEASAVTSKKMEDGRTMLSVVAYIWKKYTGELLNFFKRDGGEKPVSVEMSVFDIQPMANSRFQELKDFKYEAITILGSFVTPAIPMAKSTVLSFAQIKKEYEKEFIGVSLPANISDNIKRGLDIRRHMSNFDGVTSVDLAFANSLIKQETASLEELNTLTKHVYSDDETVADLLWGGKEAQTWANEVLDKRKSEKMEMNMTKELQEVAEVTEELAVDMASPAETTDVETDTTIDTTVVETVEMAEEEREDVENPAEEEAEGPAKFEFPANYSMEMMAGLFSVESDEDGDVEKMAREEFAKGEFANPGVVMAAMFEKMQKMCNTVERMAKENEVYMAENAELKKFKADTEAEQKNFEVDKTLKELGDRFVVPAEAHEEMLAAAQDVPFAEIEGWKTLCKAKTFEFAVRNSDAKTPDQVRIGQPFNGSAPVKRNDLWS